MDRMTPNLFVLGASKCGSTSLHEILGQHPDIHACYSKEPTFFNWPFQVTRNPIEYFHQFDSPKRYRLDSSTAYLINPMTPRVLYSLFPEARCIVSLRNPKARAHSLYQNMRRYGWEDIATFREALRAEESRYTSKEFWQTCKWDFWQFLYCRSTMYDEQLERYIKLFGRDQLFAITLAELSLDPLATTQRILRFLDLDPEPARDFDFSVRHRNSSYEKYDADSDQIMSLAFHGLVERTEEIVGRALDWSV